MLSGSFRRVRRGVATNTRVGFMGARPSMAMMDSPKSRASGPTDMTAQAYMSLGSLANARPRKRHSPANFRGRKAGETCQKSGGFHQRRVLRRALPSVRTWRPRATASIRPGQRHHSFWAAPLLPALSSRVDENHPISGRTPSPKLHVSRKEACIGALGLRRGLFLARSSKNGACICIVLSSWEDSDSLVGAYNDASCRSRPRRTLQNNSC